MPTVNPYTIGNWVRGDDHYGRVAVIDRILKGKDKHLWILATRRAGKTSLLQQVANLVGDEPHYVPLLWDMEGCSDKKMLTRAIAYSLRKLQRKYQDICFTEDELRDFDLFELLDELALKVNDNAKELLLLCDEPEALLIAFKNDPNGLSRLRRCLQQEGVRSVLVSSLHLFELDSIPTVFDRFLEGFAQIGLPNLTWEEALGLMQQSQNKELPSDFPHPNEEESKDIFDKTLHQISNLQKKIEFLQQLKNALLLTQEFLRKELISAVNEIMNNIWSFIYPYNKWAGIRLNVSDNDYILELKSLEGDW
ncbi:MAG: hypothetical protein ONB05_05845, partial [candidate division KSB1 bacterium]|nr:hypothetical protein [candidate division KSB1 bacterium]